MAATGGEPHIRLASPDTGEEEVAAVREVLATGILTNGPRTKEFEEEFARRHQAEHAVAVANGTIALSAIYLALDIGPGDEVIVPSTTFVSSATSVVHVGATPVFADIDPETFNIDPRDAAKRISSRTKAILAVHYGGQPADLDDLADVAQEAKVALIEDAAQAHGATFRGRPVGTFGRAAMFSFTGTKNITTGEGGMVTTNDGDIAERIRLLRNHARSERHKYVAVGFNWRMTEMQAAIGVVQLRKLDSITRRKVKNASWMAERLCQQESLRVPAVRADRDHVYTLYTLLTDSRTAVLEALTEAGIEARIYFPPVHLEPIFAEHASLLPVAEDVGRRMVSIPFHSQLTEADLDEMSSVMVSAADRSLPGHTR